MRKYIIILVFLLASAKLFSQNMLFSFYANPQLSWFSGSDDSFETNGTFVGVNLGLEADFFFRERYAFTTGVSLNNMKGGVIYNDSISFETGDTREVLRPGSRMTHNLQYISIPVGLKFKTIEIGYSTFWLNTGISPMILIKSTVSDKSKTFDKSQFRSETSPFNLNYFIKAGIEYNLGGNTALIGGLGYSSGFVDITKRNTESINTRNFSLIFGIIF